MKAQAPNEYRYRNLASPFYTEDSAGMNGAFSFTIKGRGHRVTAHCIVSDGSEVNGVAGMELLSKWEHVSVHIEEFKKLRTPTWDEMCVVKDMFWDTNETVIQYHPAAKDYVNCHPHVLHLWKQKDQEFPTPPKIAV